MATSVLHDRASDPQIEFVAQPHHAMKLPVVRRGSFTSMQLKVKNLKDHFSEAKMNFFVPSRVPLAELKSADGGGSGKFVVEYNKDDAKCNYQLLDVDMKQRVFITLDQITSSYFSMIYGTVITLVVLSSVSLIIMQSFEEETFRPDTCASPTCNNDPTLCPGTQICEKEIKQQLLDFEFAMIVIIGIDYLTRMGLCAFVPARIAGVVQKEDLKEEGVSYPWTLQVYYYASLPFNVIDLLATLPIFIVFFFPGVFNEQNVLSIALRMFRLGRLMRVMKLPALREGVNMLKDTLTRALPALTLLSIVLIFEMLFFGQLIFIFERGVYTINEDFPDGAYLRWNTDRSAKEESPFSDMFVSMYWVLVTITTVGYGDLYPNSMPGRWITMVLMFVSVLVVAMPIGVIGGEFSELYRFNNEKRKLRKQKKKEAAIAQALAEASARNMSEILASGDPRLSVKRADTTSSIISDQEGASPPLETKETVLARLAVVNAQINSLMQEAHLLLQKSQVM